MAGDKSDDPIIYFTLIDFLVQLIFLAIFLFVALNAAKQAGNADEGPPAWVFDPKYLPLLNESISPFIRSEDANQLRKLLDEINRRELLDPLLKFLQSSKNPLETLRACAANPETCSAILERCSASPASCSALATMSPEKFDAIGKGAGKPICRNSVGDEVIFDVVGESDDAGARYVIDAITTYGEAVLREEDIDAENGTAYDTTQFRRAFRKLANKSCWHVVRYVDRTDSNKQGAVVRRIFLPKGEG